MVFKDSIVHYILLFAASKNKILKFVSHSFKKSLLNLTIKLFSGFPPRTILMLFSTSFL